MVLLPGVGPMEHLDRTFHQWVTPGLTQGTTQFSMRVIALACKVPALKRRRSRENIICCGGGPTTAKTRLAGCILLTGSFEVLNYRRTQGPAHSATVPGDWDAHHNAQLLKNRGTVL